MNGAHRVIGQVVGWHAARQRVRRLPAERRLPGDARARSRSRRSSTCGDTQVAWIEIPAAGQDPETLEHPAPTVTVVAPGPASPAASPLPDVRSRGDAGPSVREGADRPLPRGPLPRRPAAAAARRSRRPRTPRWWRSTRSTVPACPISPTGVSVTFNEDVSLAPGGLRVIRPDGSLADIGDEVVQRRRRCGQAIAHAVRTAGTSWPGRSSAPTGTSSTASSTFAVGDADAAARPAAVVAALAAGGGPVGHPRPLGPDAARRRGRGDRVGGRSAHAPGASGGSGWACSSLGVAATAIWLAIEIADGGVGLAGHPVRLVRHHPPACCWRRASACCCFDRHDPCRHRRRRWSALVTLAWGGHATDSPLTSLTLADPPARCRHLAGCRARGRARDVGPIGPG